MKQLATILSLFIFSIAVLPCSDGQTCSEDTVKNTIEHDHSDDAEDNCSPFCICDCCGLTLDIQTISFEIQHLVTNTNLTTFNFNPQYHSKFSKAFWVPPTDC